MSRSVLLALAFSVFLPGLLAQTTQTYQQPQRPILDLVDAENPPQSIIDAHCRTIALVQRPAFRTLKELAQPELRLAGLRINPRTHGAARTNAFTHLSLQDMATGRPISISGMPEKIRFLYPSFSPDGSSFAFIEEQDTGLALWTVQIKTGRAHRVTDPKLSATLGIPYIWAPDGLALYIRVRPSLTPFNEAQQLPLGPNVQEATGVKAPSRTFQDLLKNPADEDRFSYFATVAIHRVDLDGKVTTSLRPGMYREIQPSPDGDHLLVTEIQRPFSYLFPSDRFPYRTRVMGSDGRAMVELVDKPLQDKIPVSFDAVETGRRQFAWREDVGSTVVWAEALDAGNPDQDATYRDALYQLQAPFQGIPRLLWKTPYRFAKADWGDAKTAIFAGYWWKTRRLQVCRVDPSITGEAGQVVFDRSEEDDYGDPGYFVTAPNSFNRQVLRFSADRKSLFLQGEGCSPEGNRPFLDRIDLASLRTTRLWRAAGVSSYESILKVIDPENGQLLNQVEGPSTFPNLYLRTFGRKEGLRSITNISNPYKSLDAVKKEIIKYKRADGVELSATLHLPPGYDAARDGRLPVLMDAYPLEYKDSGTAGQLRDSPYRFSRPYWGSPIYWVLRGYAVLESTQFPIVGQGKDEPNDTYVTQLVADAKAAIDELDRRGVGDPKRVACVGHSYGAFMVANLLAHSNLFAAGIARSGAYNRTLTPFGFQAEERNYWQAPNVYQAMSPFNFADKIKSPILLVHGEADNNPGTFTLQSERLFQAIKGLGGRARLVLLPFESHGYAARENILHLLWEQDTWLETYVKNTKGKS